LRSGDAGRVVAGDPVTIKIDAFPWRRHGILDGVLGDVGHASFTPEGSQTALHPGHVLLSDTEMGLRNMPTGAALLPGMTLSAEVRIGTRSLLDLLIDPVLRGMRESFREP
jgi:HlyD family secretion protein